MKGQKKRPKVAGIMRQVLGRNVKALMNRHYSEHANKPKALAKAAGVSLSTVQRIIAAEIGASLDNIEAIALALDASTYQLLIPALDAKNPQVVKGAEFAEQRLYKMYQRKEQLVWEDEET